MSRRDEDFVVQNVVITGATGYLGSHLALHLLAENTDANVVCLARVGNGKSAEARLLTSLRTALSIAGRNSATTDLPERWRREKRLTVVDCGDLSAADALVRLPSIPLADGPTEFYHCAAAVAFTEVSEGAVRFNNMAALDFALKLAQSIGCADFNHVSTAYVSGTRHGALVEAIGPRPEKFNNIYEESKFDGEVRVASFCTETKMSYRIHRPSVIIGHSRTKQTSSNVGFYYCLEIIRQFYNKVTLGESLFFRNRTLHVKLDADATLNLVPIDVVVDEMLAIRAGGTSTLNQVFHETNPTPLSLNAVITALSQIFGVPNVEPVGSDSGLGMIDKIFNKKMKLLNPYLSRQSHFDRTNVIRAGADRHDPRGVIDSETLKAYANAYYNAPKL